MKILQVLSVVLLGLRHYGVVAQAGYFVDTVSCSGPQRDAVRRVLANSFKMVQAGLDNVDRADEDINSPEQKLIDNLFGTEANTNTGIRCKSPLPLDNIGMRNAHMMLHTFSPIHRHQELGNE